MEVSIIDINFHTIILGSLPKSYHPLLFFITATTAAKITKSPISPYELISIIMEEFKHRQLTDCCPGKKGSNATLATKDTKGRVRMSTSSMSKDNPDIRCYNCEQKEHYKADC